MQHLIGLFCVGIASTASAFDGPELRCAETVSSDDYDIAVGAFETLRSCREKLVTGEYVASGQVEYSKDGELLHSGDVEWRSRFDYISDSLLFIRVEPSLYQQHGKEMEVIGKAQWITLDSRFIVRDGECWEWNSLQNTSVIGRPFNSEVHPLARPISVRLIGVTSLANLWKHKDIDRVLERYSGSELVNVDSSGERLSLEFKVTSGPITVETSLVLDAKRDFVPLQYDVFLTDQIDESSMPKHTNHCVCEWGSIDDTWVPLSVEAFQTSSRDPDKQYNLAFLWESVNKPLGQDRFDYTQLDVPTFARVYDRRGATPQVIGTLNSTVSQTPALAPPKPANRQWFWWINGCVLMVVVWALLRKNRRA